MSEDYMKYDGRIPEPPYSTAEVEIERLTNELAQAKEQIKEAEAREAVMADALAYYATTRECYVEKAEGAWQLAKQALSLASPWAKQLLTESQRLRELGLACLDEGCPQYGTPHSHKEPK